MGFIAKFLKPHYGGKMKLVGYLLFAVLLIGCQQAPVEPTDGPCGPGAWTVTEGPQGVICEPGTS
jgi:hypothetical protein